MGGQSEFRQKLRDEALNTQICSAIESKRLVMFTYDGLPREVEPHAHRMSSRGYEVMLGFQIGGKSSSEKLGWRLWEVKKMKGMNVGTQTFVDARPGYRGGDS